ncbi:MAG: hypothetical protein ACKOTD_00475 [Phycisphaerales bacterium]
MQPQRPLIDWAKAVQGHVERECGFHLVRGLGGHGIGRSLHGPPFVAITSGKSNNPAVRLRGPSAVIRTSAS